MGDAEIQTSGMVEIEHPVCLVTGATHGIGLATALGLARAGAHVIVVGRDRQLTKRTVQMIARSAGSDR